MDILILLAIALAPGFAIGHVHLFKR